MPVAPSWSVRCPTAAEGPAQRSPLTDIPPRGTNGGVFTRRSFLIASALSGTSALAACSSKTPTAPASSGIDQQAIAAAEAARPHTGRTVTATLTPRPTTVDLGGVSAQTLAYSDHVPGPLIRASVGDELAVTVSNGLDHETSIHWHGIALRNDMDGASPATPNIKPGNDFTYRFSAPHAGTYWAHPHTGVEADTGLYLPLIIDDPKGKSYYGGLVAAPVFSKVMAGALRVGDAGRVQRIAGVQDAVAERERAARSPRPAVEHHGEVARAHVRVRAELAGWLHEPALPGLERAVVLVYRLAVPAGTPAPHGSAWVSRAHLAGLALEPACTLALGALG